MGPRRRRSTERTLIIVAAGLLGAALAAAPTGQRGLDVLWSAAFAAAMAYAGAFASPLTLLPVGAAAAVLVGDRVALAMAAGSVLAAAGTAGQDRPSSRLTGISGGLLGLALLQRGDGSTLSVLGGGVLVVVVVLGSGWRGLSRRRRRTAVWVLGGVVAVVGVLALAGGLAGLRARADADRGIDALRAARAAATAGDVEGAVAGFEAAERAFRDATAPLTSYGRLGKAVPGLAQQLTAATTSVETAADAATALRQVAASVQLDDIALQGGAVDLAAVSATEAPLQTAVDTLVDTVVRLARIDRDGLLPPIRDALDDALAEARAASATVERAHRTVRELPALLGGERPTRFLVLFTSPVEARNRFGFPGAHAVLRFDAGRLTFERAGPINELAPPGGRFEQASLLVPDRAEPFAAYGVTQDWRSVTLPSHGPAVADLAIQMGAQAGLGAIDGVVLADPHVLAEVIRLTGDVQVPGLDIFLTPKNTVDFLVRDQYLEFPELGQSADRKDALALVAGVVGEQLESLSMDQVGDLADRFGSMVADGHLVVSVPTADRPDAAALFADLALDGGFPPVGAADLLHVGHVNSGGNKIDLFLRRRVGYEVAIDEGGALEATLSIDLENQAPAGGLPFYLIGAAADPPPPLGTNRTTVLIYSRHELAEMTVDGVPLLPQTLIDGGIIVYQVSMDLGPGQSRRIEARLEGFAPSEGYALQLRPNGLAAPDEASVEIRDARSEAPVTWVGTVDGPTCVRSESDAVRCEVGRAP